jgi:outer membrane biosynthesis protein TonB
MPLTRKFIIGSLIFHIGILLVASIIGLYNSSIQKRFVVFGAHTKKPTHVSYKTFKSGVPFAFNNGKKVRGKKGKHPSSHSSKSKKTKNKKTKTSSKKQKQSKKKTTTKQKRIERKNKFAELDDQEDVHQKKNIKKKKKEQKSIKKPKPKPAPEVEQEPEKKDEPEEDKIQENTPQDTVQEKEPDITQEEQPDQTNNTIAPEKETDENITEDETAGNDDGIGFSLLEDEQDNGKMREYQKHVQQEVDRLWKPPLGVTKGTECSVLFYVNTDGSVEKFEFIKRSGVLIYDLSITRIAKNFQFNKCLWGKQFKIDFRQ